MNRRGFIGAILAAASAPAFVRAESLMRVAAPAISEPEAPATWERSASGLLVPGHSLKVGDRITISGSGSVFRVALVTASGCSITRLDKPIVELLS